MSFEPSPEVWVHGLLPLPGAHVTENSLLVLLELPRVTASDRTIGLQQWTELADKGLKLSAPQAAACMRLCFVLSQPSGSPQPMPPDVKLRVPLGSLLLLLWVQWAHHELGEGSASNTHRAQAASGEVWPSLLLPPAAAASAVMLDSGSQQSARTLAVQARLHSSVQIARRRRKLLQSSLPTLLQLAGTGAERLYAYELDLLSMLVRPDAIGAARLHQRGLPPRALSDALGLWSDQPADKLRPALPVGTLLPALRAALVEVATQPARTPRLSMPPPGSAAGAAPATRSPLGIGAPTAAALSPTTPLTPIAQPTLRPMVSISDADEREGSPTTGLLSPCPEGATSVPGGGVLRLHGAKRRTVILRECDLRGGSIQLIDCHGCYIYALCHLRAAELLGCCGCTVVLGAVSHVVSFSHCEATRLYLAAKALRLSNCNECALFACVNSPPLLWGENHRLALAPLGTAYAGMAAHMAAAALHADLSHNLWSAPTSPAGPLQLTDRFNAAAAAGAGCVGQYALLPPAKFLPFHIPVDAPSGAGRGEGVSPPCELPSEYASALVSSVERVHSFQKELLGLDCPAAVRAEVQGTLHAGFEEWLRRTGNIRQITDLMAMPAS